LTNPTEAQYAQSSAYQQKLANEIARGIQNRYSVASSASSSRVAATETVPLQPFLDQTRMGHSSRSASKSTKSHKSHSKKTASKKKKAPDSEN
jgi:hypothetical protein